MNLFPVINKNVFSILSINWFLYNKCMTFFQEDSCVTYNRQKRKFKIYLMKSKHVEKMHVDMMMILITYRSILIMRYKQIIEYKEERMKLNSAS